MRLIGRLLVIAIGYFLAAAAGCAVGLIGALQWTLSWLAQHNGPDMVDVMLAHMEAEAARPWAGLGFFTAMVLAPLALLALAALAAELFAIRSGLVWSFGLALAYAAIPNVLVRGEGALLGPVGFFAAGLAAGTLYWLIAGRQAGRIEATRSGPEPGLPTGG